VIGPAARFPLQSPATSAAVPAQPVLEAPKEALFALHARLGIDRSVIVQSARHGLDNSAVEDAISAGGGRYLGIAIVPTDVDDAELGRLAACGFRGVRFNFMRHLGAAEPIEAVMALAPRLAGHGLHLQVHFESELIHGLAPHLAESPVPVVIDHMARVDASKGPDHADFMALRRLLADERFLVKVSGVDRIDRGPPYAAGVALARLLVESFPDRCLWGTDWPHVNHHHCPDDKELAVLTAAIAPDADLRQRLLVRNPERFYRFDPLPIKRPASDARG
jgi:2-pyrone-4,6-dicarboxylate lactonase